MMSARKGAAGGHPGWRTAWRWPGRTCPVDRHHPFVGDRAKAQM